VQILLGLGFLLLPGRYTLTLTLTLSGGQVIEVQITKILICVSIAWAIVVWYGGEGMSMLLTGTASILSGAPGAVLLYPLLGLAIWPRKQSNASLNAKNPNSKAGEDNLPSWGLLRWVLSGFWFFAALLQLQPIWWQPGQISQSIGAMVGQGGLNAVLVDPVLTQLANAAASIEVQLNIALIVLFLTLSIGLARATQEELRPFLIVSIIASALFWYGSQAFGMILTGMATDFNTGLLVVVIALACWPKAKPLYILWFRRNQSMSQGKTHQMRNVA